MREIIALHVINIACIYGYDSCSSPLLSYLIGVITYFCPCYMFGKAAESVGDSCCLCGLVYFVGPVNLYARTHIRGKIREKKGINVSGVGFRATTSWDIGH